MLKSRLAIGTYAPSREGTGVSTYSESLRRAANLIGARPEIIVDDIARPKWKRRLLAVRPFSRTAFLRLNAIAVLDVFREAQVFFDIYRRPLEIVCPGAPGIAHWSYPMPLRLRGWNNIYTVHDAIPLTAPNLVPIDRKRHRRLLASLMKSAVGFVTVSESARLDLIGALDCQEDFVTNLGQPIDVDGVEVSAPVRNNLIEGGYFIYCGTIEPRKNIARLVEAHIASGVAMPLVLVGPAGWRSEEIFVLIERQPKVVWLNYIERCDLLGLIKRARAMLMPSLAEGFGLPIAEAMALGTPVMTSNRGALSEISGDAALLIDPYNVAEMARSIGLLARDDTLCARLSEAGVERARIFSIQAFAKRLRDFYRATGK